MALLANRLSLWGDEAFVAQTIRLPLPSMVRLLGHIDFNMGAYYLTAKFWASIFGYSAVALRALSIVYSAATLVVVHRFANRFYGRRAAAAAVVLLGLNPFFIRIALTARPYALLQLVTIAATLWFARAMADDRARDWVAVVVLDLLSVHVSLLAIFVIAAQALFFLGSRHPIRRQHMWVAVALCLGMIPTLLFIAPKDTLEWVDPLSPHVVYAVAKTLTGGSRLLLLAIGVTAVLAMLRPPQVNADSEARRLRWVVPSAVALPVALILLASLYQPLVVDEYFSFILPPTALIIGAWLSRPPRRALLTGALAGVLAVIIGASAYEDATSVRHRPGVSDQDWRGLSTALSANVKPGDAIAFVSPYYRIAAEYYAGPNTAWLRATPILPSAPWHSLTTYQLDLLNRVGVYDNPEEVVNGVAGHRTVWLVGRIGSAEQHEYEGALLANGYTERQQLVRDGAEADLYVKS